MRIPLFTPGEPAPAVGAATAPGDSRSARPRTSTRAGSPALPSCAACGLSASILLIGEAFCAADAVRKFGPEFLRRWFRAKGVAA